MTSSRFRNILNTAKESPGDAVTFLTITTIVVVTLLDMFDVLSLGQEFLSAAAIVVLSAFLVTLLASKKAAVEQKGALQNVVTDLGAIKQDIEIRGTGAHVIEIPREEIGRRLDELLNSANSWHFRGGLGGWQRSTALPALASVMNQDISYVMHILNPANEDLCHRYANYRASAGQRTGTTDPQSVRDELLALLYAAAWYQQRTRVKPDISFLSNYSPLRYDLSNAGLIVTVPDMQERAIYAPAGGWYCTSVRDELEQAGKALPAVVLPSGDDMFPRNWRDVRAQHVMDALEAVRVRPSRISDQPSLPLLADWAESQNLDFEKIAQLPFKGRSN
ncbi:hypothetical protein HHL19_03110 [Streptomyces sp. R302]|uniref:hypothetical protein n=1 Tax=unclassified Streptomyces TaxID=2593676 RepID=UPI00145D98E9|nr:MULTISPECIES: hypothetical protein [unclassified Streptomyces]NML49341.1 hypothetical protein [Streptomyces sp. R301]NML77668.1 hypothetical protein [Streptomyces sp. R302]